MFRKKLGTILLCILYLTLGCGAIECGHRRIVGFYEGKVAKLSEYQASQLTHLIIGNVYFIAANAQLWMERDWESNFNETLGIARTNPTLRILVSVSENMDDAYFGVYERLLQNEELRAVFIKNILHFLQAHNLHGLNIDRKQVETGQGEKYANKQIYVDFLDELAAKFDGNFVLSIYGPYTKRMDGTSVLRNGFNLPLISRAIQFFNIGSFGYHAPGTDFESITGPIAPLYKSKTFKRGDTSTNVHETMRYYACSIGTLEQLNMGIALFARMQSHIEPKRLSPRTKLWMKAPYSTAPNEPDYRDIPLRELTLTYGEDLNFVADYDTDTRSAFLYDEKRKHFYGLETSRSLQKKLEYAVRHGVGGFYLSNIEYDDVNNTILNLVAKYAIQCADQKNGTVYHCDDGTIVDGNAKKRSLKPVIIVIASMMTLIILMALYFYCLPKCHYIFNDPIFKELLREYRNQQQKELELLLKGKSANVYKAQWGDKIVAAKSYKKDTEARMNFMNECRIMVKKLKELKNKENICCLLSVQIIKKEIWLFYELAEHSDLKTFLLEHKPKYMCLPILWQSDLVNICLMVANGLRSLTDLGIIHRDLAARNCLVFSRPNCSDCGQQTVRLGMQIVVKISDFGMAYMLEKKAFKAKNYACICPPSMEEGAIVLPRILFPKTAIRWCAPESLQKGEYSHKSDIWSFGIVLFEIFSYAAIPFGHLGCEEDVESQIVQGAHPDIGSIRGLPDEMAALMRECWQSDEERRIDVDLIVKELQQF